MEILFVLKYLIKAMATAQTLEVAFKFQSIEISYLREFGKKN
jgi:hypothetical protein